MKTVIIGASPNPTRYAHMAAQRLEDKGHEFVPVSIKKGEVLGKEILNIRDEPPVENVHTVTMYVSASHFEGWEDYVIGLKPKRIVFNPGSENEVLESMAQSAGIEVVHGCTLVMLGTGEY